VPIVLGGTRAGRIEHPLAVVILGGLATSTLLNLFIVPALYLQFGRSARSTAEESSEHLKGHTDSDTAAAGKHGHGADLRPLTAGRSNPDLRFRVC
jgi:hypothetical protein